MTWGIEHGRGSIQHLASLIRVNLPKACDPRSQTWSRFYLTLAILFSVRVNLLKAYDLRSWLWPGSVQHLAILIRFNLPKACDPRSWTWPRFCLALSHCRIKSADTNKSEAVRVKKKKGIISVSFINSNIFAGYLHSKAVGYHFHLSLLDNRHLSLPLMLCGRVLPS